MPEYPSISAVLTSSLREYLSASKLSLEFRKPTDWGSEAGHCLGFAAGLLLFCVVDAIGSYHRGSRTTFPIDGKPRSIDGADFRHFFVLNAPEYYGQFLGHAAIKELYDKYRNLLTHNASIAIDSAIIYDPGDSQLFPTRDQKLLVNLHAFHNRSVAAVEAFLAKGVAESSTVVQNMRLKQ